MATTSYGSITIVDITDVGEFSVYPQANKAQTQIYNPDKSGDLAYTPDWHANNNALIITPTAFYAGKNKTSVATYSWKKYINGVETSFTANEIVANTARHESLTVNANVLTISNPVVTYEVKAEYSSSEFGETPLEAVGRIDFSLISQGSSVPSVRIVGENIFAYNASKYSLLLLFVFLKTSKHVSSINAPAAERTKLDPLNTGVIKVLSRLL